MESTVKAVAYNFIFENRMLRRIFEIERGEIRE
jgi:hypothetical protein